MPLLLPFYKDRDTPVHRLHPAVKMATVMAVVVAALVMTHPNYLLALLAGTVVVAGAARVLREWWAFMRLFALIALMVVVINALVSSRGETTFWEGPYVWGFGKTSISLEGVVTGVVMALRLYVVVAAFTIVSLTVHPDEFTQLLARFAYRSGLAVSLSTRFYPAVVRDASAIVDAQRSRGLDMDTGGRLARIRHRMPVVMPLFHSSLERAVGTAEAMEARGFGSPRRTVWRRRGWAPRDLAAMLAAAALAVTSVALALWGDAAPSYYPDIQLEAGGWTLLWQSAMVALMAAPVVAVAGGGDGDG